MKIHAFRPIFIVLGVVLFVAADGLTGISASIALPAAGLWAVAPSFMLALRGTLFLLLFLFACH